MSTGTVVGRDATPDAHLFPKRPYDLVREFTIALGIIVVLTLALAGVLSSPDRPAITLADWAKAAPADVVATATMELAGTSPSASYGPPYNHAARGQTLGPAPLASWGGVRIPVNSADDLVINPLRSSANDPELTTALSTWHRATPAQQARWANAYLAALTKAPNGTPTSPQTGAYGPVPLLTDRYLGLARSGALQGLLTASTFYAADQTKPLLLLSDGSYLEEQARADHLGGDQWGMMNETGNYPGQPWMWLYTFWYQIPPFSTSDNADALVWGVMAVLTLALILLPFIPGLRALPKHLGVHRLIWRNQA
jgi:hypothetical protein